MNLSCNIEELKRQINSFNPEVEARGRSLAIFSASVAIADKKLIRESIEIAISNKISPEELYEVILQSYLFLGFPRMLSSAEILEELFPDRIKPTAEWEASTADILSWQQRGHQLCEDVYKGNFEKLKDRVTKRWPEIFQWMIVEGYGKVLSRPGLSIVERELSIIAFLMMENRPKQLYSHLLGAFNVGADNQLVRLIVEEIGKAAGDGYHTALEILERLES